MSSPTHRGIAIEDPIISFRDIEEDLKIQIWLWIQNGVLDRFKKYQVHDKRQGSTFVSNFVTDSVAVSEIRDPDRPSGEKKNKRDSTEIRKTRKDSNVIEIF